MICLLKVAFLFENRLMNVFTPTLFLKKGSLLSQQRALQNEKNCFKKQWNLTRHIYDIFTLEQ